MDENQYISRSGEKILGIIGIVFNLLAIGLIVFSIFSLGNVENDPEFRQFLEEQIMADPGMSDMGDIEGLVDGLLTSFDVVMWVLVGLLGISTIFAILAIGRLGKSGNPNMGGVFFIVAGLFAGLLSLTSILFYVAALMCFVRKGRNGSDNNLRDDEKVHRESNQLRDQDSLRYEEQRLRDERLREEERLRDERLREEERGRGTTGNDFVDREDDRLKKDDDTPYRPL